MSPHHSTIDELHLTEGRIHGAGFNAPMTDLRGLQLAPQTLFDEDLDPFDDEDFDAPTQIPTPTQLAFEGTHPLSNPWGVGHRAQTAHPQMPLQTAAPTAANELRQPLHPLSLRGGATDADAMSNGWSSGPSTPMAGIVSSPGTPQGSSEPPNWDLDLSPNGSRTTGAHFHAPRASPFAAASEILPAPQDAHIRQGRIPAGLQSDRYGAGGASAMRTSSSESSNGGASTVQPRGMPRDAEDEPAGPSTLRPISKASGRGLDSGPTLLTHQRPEPMEDEMPIQLNTQVGGQPTVVEAALRDRQVQRTAGQAGVKPESPAAHVSSGSSGSRGVRFREGGVQSNPLYRARRNEGERRAARRVPSVETWLIMEYCNCGTLRDAVERGWLRSPGISRPDPQKVLHVAWEVASALTCLHNLGLAHGNLTTSNVLLSDSPDAPTGFMAKISDFGHSGACGDGSLQVRARNAGRWTPCAPELMAHGTLTKGGDVYSLGLLIIEMASGEPPWGMETPFQKAMDLSVVQKKRPPIPTFLSRSVRSLLNKCLIWDPEKRPAMHKVLKKLEKLKTASVTGKRSRGKFWRRLLGITGFSRGRHNDEVVSTTSGTTLATSVSTVTSRGSTMRTRVRQRKPAIERISPGPQRKLMKRAG